jgi:hypothetical protein
MPYAQQQPGQHQVYAQAMPGQQTQYGAAQQPQYMQHPGMQQPMLAQHQGMAMMQPQPGLVYSTGQPGMMQHPSTIPGAVPMVHTGADGQTQIVYQIPKQPTVNVTAQGMQMQQSGQKNLNPHGFQTAIPLGALSQSAAPIDCPACKVRGITSTTAISGSTTQ